MAFEAQLPPAAPPAAKSLGRPQFLRWAFLIAATGAASANLNALLTLIGLPTVDTGILEPVARDQILFLNFLANVAPPCIFVGGGLALAATVEVRRDTKLLPEVSSGQILAVWSTWTFLGLAVLGVVSPAGTP